jgi:hypothetical protein
VLLTVAILALPTVVYAFGRSSSSFAVEHIAVGGTKLIPEKRVLRLLRREFRGRNLFTVTADDVRTTLASLCYVDRVAVDRDFPGTLRVTVEEYVPVAYVLAGEHWYVIDGESHVICEVEQTDGGEAEPDTPATEDSPTPSPDPSAAPASGDDSAAAARLASGPPAAALDLPRTTVAGRVRVGAAAADAGLADRLRVVEALPGSWRARLQTIRSSGGQMTLRFAGGPTALWGDADRSLAKGIALRLVLARYASEGERCAFIDLSAPDHVLARPVLD